MKLINTVFCSLPNTNSSLDALIKTCNYGVSIRNISHLEKIATLQNMCIRQLIIKIRAHFSHSTTHKTTSSQSAFKCLKDSYLFDFFEPKKTQIPDDCLKSLLIGRHCMSSSLGIMSLVEIIA